MDFGIKPLDVLLKEKQDTPAPSTPTTVESTSESTLNKDSTNKKNLDLASLRKRNELKFKNSEGATPPTTSISIATESPKEKKLKAEPTNTITSSTSINELDDFEKELDSLPPNKLIVDTENLEEDIDIDEDLDIM